MHAYAHPDALTEDPWVISLTPTHSVISHTHCLAHPSPLSLIHLLSYSFSLTHAPTRTLSLFPPSGDPSPVFVSHSSSPLLTRCLSHSLIPSLTHLFPLSLTRSLPLSLFLTGCLPHSLFLPHPLSFSSPSRDGSLSLSPLPRSHSLHMLTGCTCMCAGPHRPWSAGPGRRSSKQHGDALGTGAPAHASQYRPLPEERA